VSKMSKADIKIDSEIAQQLREYAFKKHGRFRGAIKTEVEAAILKHIQEDE